MKDRCFIDLQLRDFLTMKGKRGGNRDKVFLLTFVQTILQ
ncbi:hypothetical protein SAMN02910340_01226 [Methanosarcina thermophila]|jgi:hypothetical protein|uniref:Uncharacterized protein n=1 Tax=Methanosarcina thermophila TaxID=2210 RepID=A0A1I6Z263_METTE|nr:hypothetical protein SAMN02910340_01226 [Methanosarcina thermophila]